MVFRQIAQVSGLAEVGVAAGGGYWSRQTVLWGYFLKAANKVRDYKG